MNHPDFEKAPEEGRWTGELKGLFPVLAREAYRAHGRWVSRVLPRGAYVQMSVNVDDGMRLVLRICRREAPADDAGRKKWDQEVAIFRRELAPDLGRRWGEPVMEEVRGGIAAEMIALFLGETKKGKTECADCAETIAYDPAFTPNRCTICAIKAGQREAAQQNLELGRAAS